MSLVISHQQMPGGYNRRRNLRYLGGMVKAQRCSWCGDDPLYVEYHDHEWGVPEHDGGALFERLVLEGMQAGLSWYTILKKREHMREVFFGFQPAKLARYGPRRMDKWLQDPGIIRHRGKLEAMVENARCYLQHGDFAGFIWSFVDGRPVHNRWRRLDQIPASTPASVAMAKSLKAQGFRFVGPTTCYAFMQSTGLVNDHLTNCPAHQRCKELG
jgi:DNA-3-methyladenine glycosylase I